MLTKPTELTARQEKTYEAANDIDTRGHNPAVLSKKNAATIFP
jgi:hypothetical protein